jgi:Fe2+ transport system protein B
VRELLDSLKDNFICRRKRSQMMRTYLSGKYFLFDSDNHISYCSKCQVAGKRYKAFREELESEVNKEVEVPSDFASKVIDSLDKKVKTTTNKGTKIILLSLIGLISLLILVFGIKRSSNEIDDIDKD